MMAWRVRDASEQYVDNHRRWNDRPAALLIRPLSWLFLPDFTFGARTSQLELLWPS